MITAATSTATIMIGTCGVMPTAVITESSENTMSITMICSDHRGERALAAGGRAPPRRLRACRGSRRCSWRSGTGRRRAGSAACRRAPSRRSMNSGSVSRITQVMLEQQARCARSPPSRCRGARAFGCSAAGSRPARMAMKMTLSIPSTTSSDDERQQRDQAGEAPEIAARGGGREQRARRRPPPAATPAGSGTTTKQRNSTGLGSTMVSADRRRANIDQRRADSPLWRRSRRSGRSTPDRGRGQSPPGRTQARPGAAPVFVEDASRRPDRGRHRRARRAAAGDGFRDRLGPAARSGHLLRHRHRLRSSRPAAARWSRSAGRPAPSSWSSPASSPPTASPACSCAR